MDRRKSRWIAWSVSVKNETCAVLKSSAVSDGQYEAENIKARKDLKNKYWKINIYEKACCSLFQEIILFFRFIFIKHFLNSP